VEHGSVLHVGAAPHDHGGEVGADDRAVPHRRAVLDRDVSDNRRRRGDEGCIGDDRFVSLELVQWHADLRVVVPNIMTNPTKLGSVGLAAILLASCGRTTTQPVATPSVASSAVVSRSPAPEGFRAPSPTRRIAVVVMENKEYGAVAGSPDAPYLNGLARRSAVAESYFAVTHPSLPNYLALIGGDTFGITSDCTGCHVSARNVVDQLKAAGITWKAYMDGVPRPCFTGSSAGRYAKKHNPFVYFDDIARDRARCSKIVPMTQLRADERAMSRRVQ